MRETMKRVVQLVGWPFAHTSVLPYVCTLGLLVSLTASAQQPSAKSILEKAGRHYEAVKDYTADAKITVKSPSIQVPEMNVRIFYKQPDKLHLESKDGFAVLPRQGAVVGNPLKDLIPAKDLTVIASEKMLGEDCFVIKGTFEKDGRTTQSTVWVEKKHSLVRQILANPEWGPSVRIKLWYTRIAQTYWLPSTTTAQVSLPPLPSGSHPREEQKSDEPTIVAIKFSKYKVNTGLSDSIFKQERGK